MKKTIAILASILFLSVSCSQNAGNQAQEPLFTMASPDGNLTMGFYMTPEGTPQYSLDFQGRPVVLPSSLGYELRGNLKAQKVVVAPDKVTKEDTGLIQHYYNEMLGRHGEAPEHATAEICEQIVRQHLDSPAMLTILPLQDWLAMDAVLRYEHADRERINIPAIPRHYWRYRMHRTIEDLLGQADFNQKIKTMLGASGRYLQAIVTDWLS